MKNANSIELTRQWCKKELPQQLKKSGAAFEKAVDDLSKARSGLKPGDASAIKALEKALDALEKAAKDVAAEAKALAAKEKDKAVKTDLTNTVSVMDKPLAKAVAAVRGEIEDAETEENDPDTGGGDEDEASDDKLADPVLHAAYLKKISPKLKRKTFNFALGFPSNDVKDMRFNFHPKKGGRSLGSQLKKACGSKKFTFGRAGTGALAGEVTGDPELAGRTLVLYLEGRKIPSLAKRVKLMLRTMKIPAFSKVKIIKDGQELESADDDTDLTVEAVDLDTPDPEDETGPELEESTTGEVSADALKRRLVAVNQGLAEMTGEQVGKLRDMARRALAEINAGNLDDAGKIIAALEGRVGGTGPDTGTGSEDRAEQVRKALTGLARRIKALEDKAAAGRLGSRAQEILSMLRAGQTGDATTALAELTEALEEAEGGREQEGNDPLVVWRTVKETTDVDLGALQSAISGFPDPNLKRIAEFGLNGVTQEGQKGRQVAMMKAIMDYNGAGPDKRAAAAAKLRKEVADYRSFIENDELISLCENNPFNVKVDIRGPMDRALKRIEALIDG